MFKMREPDLKFVRTPPKRSDTRLYVVHHTVTCPDETTATAIGKMHRNREFAGIGYHALVKGSGVVAKGRPWDLQGAHVRGRNDDTFGIAFAGNFEEHPPTDAQYQGGAALLAHLIKNVYGEKPIKGHGELAATACPGSYFDIKRLENLVEQRLLGGGEDLSWEQEQSIREIERLAEMGYLNDPEAHIEDIKNGENLGDHVYLSLLRRIAEE